MGGKAILRIESIVIPSIPYRASSKVSRKMSSLGPTLKNGGWGWGGGEDGCMGRKTILRIESIVKRFGYKFFLSQKSDLGSFTEI